jgi:RimJ/RimL family protein N-acetyltransferase
MPRWWNQGLATEAARAALRYVFERIGLQEIVAFTRPDNLRSRWVMEKLGMEYSADFDHPGLPEGHPLRRHVLYRLPLAVWAENERQSK